MGKSRFIAMCLALFAAFLLLAPPMLLAQGGKDTSFRDGFVANCAPCHGATPKYPVLGARLAYDTSGHKNNGNSYYANGGGCQICHTNEGFIDYVKTGTVDPKAFVANPSQQGCFTCHTSHESWDFSLRTTKPVKLPTGVTYDLGKSNLCAMCHQVRGKAQETVKGQIGKDVPPPWGAHHGPQADVMMGTNAWEYPGKTYSNSQHGKVVADGCVTCHMSLPAGRYSFAPRLGGHSFHVVGEVHEEPKANTSGCVSCHKDLKLVAGTELFDIPAKADYDGDGKVEALQVEVKGVLEKFVNTQGTGVLQKTDPPMYAKDGKWAPSKGAKWTEQQIAALYNYKLFLEDRSNGVHNANYTIQVLYDSLKSLDPGFNESLRPK